MEPPPEKRITLDEDKVDGAAADAADEPMSEGKVDAVVEAMDEDKVDGAAAEAAVEAKAPPVLEDAGPSAPPLAKSRAPPGGLKPWTHEEILRMLRNEQDARIIKTSWGVYIYICIYLNCMRVYIYIYICLYIILLPSEFYLSVAEKVPEDFIQSQTSWSMNISP